MSGDRTIRIVSQEDLYTQVAKEKGITRSEAKTLVLAERFAEIDAMQAQSGFKNLDAPALAVAKSPETYEERVSKMTDKQIRGELKRHKRAKEKPLLKDAFSTVLLIMMENKKSGLMGKIRNRKPNRLGGICG